MRGDGDVVGRQAGDGQRYAGGFLTGAHNVEGQDNYPPYDIVRTGEETYRISLAVAGFAPDDITVTAQQNLLTVAGRKSEEKTETSGKDVLYRGISARSFERKFSLEDHVEVEQASYENGLCRSIWCGGFRRR